MSVVVSQARFGAGPAPSRRRKGTDLVLKWTFLLASSVSTSAFLYGVGWAAIQVF